MVGTLVFQAPAIAAQPAAPALVQPPSSDELLSATRKARDAKDFDRAEQLARQGMTRFSDPVWPLTLALILADQRRTTEALAILDQRWPGGLPHVERLMAEGYANMRGENPWAALDAYGQVLMADPANREANEAVSGLLERAMEQVGPDAIMQWSKSIVLPSPALRFARTDERLARLTAEIAEERSAQPPDAEKIRRIRIDRLMALRDRSLMAEAIVEANALEADGPLPANAALALADALLYERRPEAALAYYEKVLELDPANLNADYGRVFALVETERHADAISAADVIASRFRQAEDPEYVYAASLSAEVRLWADLAAEGHRRLQALADSEPGNAALHRSLSSAMNARGWRRAAESEAKIAASVDPASFQSRALLSEMELSRRRLDNAKAQSDRLAEAYPESRRVQRLSQEVAAARGWSLEAEITPKWNEGGGTNASGEEWNSLVRLDTPLIASGLRLFASSDSSIAHPPEGKVSRHRATGGISFRSSDISATLFASANWGTADRGGAGFTASWDVDDRFSVGASGETFARQIPLRAVHYGVTANSLSGWAAWRHSELAALSSGIEWLSYTDGNDRLSVSLSGEHRLWTRPRLDVTGRASLWYSTNSEQGPYFSPEWEGSATAGITIRHLAWRRYEKLFSHVLAADFGFQDQDGFSSKWIGSIRYEHRWRWDPWREIYYSLLIDRRVYDGDPERGIGLRLGLRQKF